MLNVIEVGSCNAILASISTKVDGSLKVTLEINPQDHAVISRLIQRFIENQKLLQVGFIGVNHE